MDGGAVVLVHLVELIDAADARVRQHQGSALQGHLAGLVVANHGRGETHAAGALAGGVHRARGDVHSLLQQLALGHPGITHEERVDVTTNLHAVLLRLCDGTHQSQQQRLLHVVVSENLRRNGPRGTLVELLLALEVSLVDLPIQLLRILRFLVIPMFVLLDEVGVEVHLLHGALLHRLEPRQRVRAVHACNSDCLPRKDLASEVAGKNHIDAPRDATNRDMLASFLHPHLLILREDAISDVAIELAHPLVVLALLGRAFLRGRVALALDGEEHVRLAHLALVVDELDLRLHLADPHHKAIELHQAPHVVRENFAHR
mmetsp:Transcript_123192/g.275137  ORF Transcript_123192/g.275137 Transcript_123192/m.275137 type:complete len:317 (-) Transcript_123192:659-1609(-)